MADNLKSAIDSTYVRPQAANTLMKKAQSVRQTVYIYGATGFGKTSLITDFLARRKYEYYSMRDDDLLKNIGSKSKQARIVVVDDLHLVSEPDRRRAVYEGLNELSRDPTVWLVLLSRCPIPAWLMPLYVDHIFVIIGESELSLSEEDEDAYFEKWSLSPMPDARRRLREQAVGHPLFSRIVAMRLRSLPRDFDSNEAQCKAEIAVIENAFRDLWDYLSAHVCDYWSMDMVEFMMDISIVPKFNLQMAQFITKKDNIGQLILQAQETGNFLTEHTENGQTIYEIREVFRLFWLRELTRRHTKKHIDELYYRAGSCYESHGKIPDALRMYEKCHHEEAISRLLISNLRKYTGSAHHWELRKYYMALSEDIIKRNPELMAGMSLLQSILMDDEESERWYQCLKSYADTQRGREGSIARAKLVYLDFVLPHRGTGRMIELLKHAGILLAQHRALLPEVSLTNNQPSIMHGGKDFCEWSKRDKELAATMGKLIELSLGNFGKGLVNLALAESLFEKGADNYEVSMLAQKGKMQALVGGKPELVFVAVGILAQLSMMTNSISDALESLDSFRSGIQEDAPHLLEGIDTLRTRLLLYMGRPGDVSKWMAQAPDEDEAFCTLERYRYVTKVHCYLFSGRNEKAQRLLQQLLLFAEKRQRTYLKIEAKLLLAITNFRMNEEAWADTLQEAITLAEEYHFVRILSREGNALWSLLKAREFVWTDADFKKQVFKECEHIAQLYPAYLSGKHTPGIYLSEKALKVLRLQAKGLSVQQIAEEMGLSKAGIKYYNQETYKKLGVKTQAAAINEARNRKLL